MDHSSPSWVAINRVDNYNPQSIISEPLHRFLISPTLASHDGQECVIGWIRPPLVHHLTSGPALEVFVVSTLPDKSGTVRFLAALDTAGKRSEALAKLCQHWRDTGIFGETIGPKFWRDELYPVYYNPFKRSGSPTEDVAFALERTCCSLFGFVTYGVHMNMLLESEGKVWVPKRSKTKQTWPGYLDNSVAGGIPQGLSPLEALVKECSEEASLPEDFVRQYIKPVGAVSYFFQANDGWLQPEVQYCYDLIVPKGVDAPVPKPSDGEVESFELLTFEEIQDRIAKKLFKPNCALVLIDFMIRHGYITAETEPNFMDIVTRMHGRLGF